MKIGNSVIEVKKKFYIKIYVYAEANYEVFMIL